MLLCLLLAAAGGWEPLGEVAGVKVFRQETKGSPFHAMRGIGMVDVPARLVAQVLLDDVRAHEWVDSLAEARVVRVIGPDEYIEYNHISMPPLVKDRDFITDVHMGVNVDAKTVLIESQPSDEPWPADGHIRGRLSGSYLIESVDDGKHCRLTVELHADPKGSLPAWLVNFFQKDSVRETILGIRKQVKRPELTPPPEFRAFLESITF